MDHSAGSIEEPQVGAPICASQVFGLQAGQRKAEEKQFLPRMHTDREKRRNRGDRSLGSVTSDVQDPSDRPMQVWTFADLKNKAYSDPCSIVRCR
jgi:hypothetical protein